MSMSSTVQVACFKCGGEGRFVPFMHIESGRCFQCGGTGRIEASTVPAPRRATARTVDHVWELKVLIDCATSQRDQEWGLPDADYDIAATVRFHYRAVSPAVQSRAEAAFRRAVTEDIFPSFWARVTESVEVTS